MFVFFSKLKSQSFVIVIREILTALIVIDNLVKSTLKVLNQSFVIDNRVLNRQP